MVSISAFAEALGDLCEMSKSGSADVDLRPAIDGLAFRTPQSEFRKSLGIRRSQGFHFHNSLLRLSENVILAKALGQNSG